MKYFFQYAVLLLLGVVACVPVTEEILTDVNIDYQNDKTLQRLYDLQDQQASDSLILYFNNPDPTYRYAAALSFASVKDEKALPSLIRLLGDEIEEVRIAAAYAIGQIGDVSAANALISAYNNNDSTFQDQRFNSIVLEAMGRIGDEAALFNLSTIKTFTRLDTMLLEGQAWGIYRFALRGMTLPEGTETMSNFLLKKAYPESVRLIASHYLSRAKGLNLTEVAKPLAAKVFTEQDTRLRMALAIALGKSKTSSGRDTLLLLLERERDYRVKCNIIKALGNYDYRLVRDPVVGALDDPNIHVANTAAQFMIDHGTGRDASFYWGKAKQRDSLNWQIRTKLYGAAIKHMPPNFTEYKEALNREILRMIRLSNNSYEKAAAIRAIGEYHWNYRNVHQWAYASDEPVVRTAGVQVLANIARLPDLDLLFRSSTPRVKQELIDFFVEAINKSDVAMVAIAADALRTPGLGFREVVTNIEFLEKALSKLTLPKDTETANALRRTINFYKTGEAGQIPPPEFNHPIEWRRIKALAGQSGAKIETSQGDIIITFLKDKAPVTTVNFVQLSKEGFYRGKAVHRVVPNFVIQTGCPRGDGFGSLNYSIRSELPPFHYDKQGYVGMASSGNHTECTQWFITHSPTPHLDGNYTAFAKVEEGMDVVHRLQQGDIIRNVKIIEF